MTCDTGNRSDGRARRVLTSLSSSSILPGVVDIDYSARVRMQFVSFVIQCHARGGPFISESVWGSCSLALFATGRTTFCSLFRTGVIARVCLRSDEDVASSEPYDLQKASLKASPLVCSCDIAAGALSPKTFFKGLSVQSSSTAPLKSGNVVQPLQFTKCQRGTSLNVC